MFSIETIYRLAVVSPNRGAIVQRHATFSPQNFFSLKEAHGNIATMSTDSDYLS